MLVKAAMTTLKKVLIVFTLFAFAAAGCKEVAEDPDPLNRPVSDMFDAQQQIGTIASDDIDEASGIVESRSNNNLLWTHNDSGGKPQLFLMRRDGSDVGRATMEGAQNTDWEDITIGPGPGNGVQYLYAGDIGDNRAIRNNLTIYRVAEPDLTGANIPNRQTLSNVESIDFVYSNGPRDAESLMIDPTTKNIYVVTKREAQVGLYVLPYPQEIVQMDTAEFLMNMPFTGFTAGDISNDGAEILLKTYLEIYYWSRASGESIEDALSQEPLRLKYTAEPQGEAICFATDGAGFFTISEKATSDAVPIFFYRKN